MWSKLICSRVVFEDPVALPKSYMSSHSFMTAITCLLAVGPPIGATRTPHGPPHAVPWPCGRTYPLSPTAATGGELLRWVRPDLSGMTLRI